MSDDLTESNSRALTMMNQAIDWAYGRAIEGLPGISGAQAFASEYLHLHSDDSEAAISALIKWQTIKAGTAGLVTGVGGVFTLPIAIPANVATVLYIQLRMIAAIAHIRGYDAKLDKVKGLAMACLLGSSAIDTLKDAGINIGSKLTAKAIQRIPGAVIIKLNQLVGFRLVTKAGTTGIINLPRVIPIVGGLIAGGIDAATTRGIAGAAKRIFTPISREPTVPSEPAVAASGE